jgi:hypothetical protein
MAGDRAPKKRRPSQEGPPIGNASGDPCDISFSTPLAHVRTASAGDLQPGAVLSVEVETVVQRRTVVCRRSASREIVGFVLSRHASSLIECIDQGHVYLAEIRKIDFGFVEVIVRRSS